MDSNKSQRITADMTLLEIVSTYRGIEETFKKYDERAGVCLCCQSLFDSLADTSQKYGLDLENLLSDLESAASVVSLNTEEG